MLSLQVEAESARIWWFTRVLKYMMNSLRQRHVRSWRVKIGFPEKVIQNPMSFT